MKNKKTREKTFKEFKKEVINYFYKMTNVKKKYIKKSLTFEDRSIYRYRFSIPIFIVYFKFKGINLEFNYSFKKYELLNRDTNEVYIFTETIERCLQGLRLKQVKY